ncbi:MAG TPA: MoaD/ThiS family protein [Thermoanaerobaculia bacterium]|nr:MoaD/ThiS family protein [Thermoanaerobaculia bacterium]
MGIASVSAFHLTVRLAEPFREGVGEFLTVTDPAATIGELIPILERRVPNFVAESNELFNFAVNGELIVHGEKAVTLKSGDEVELLVAFAGG